ncbi:MAG TPA: pyridoxal-dependent decarboxylase [Gemmatimonadaceae bacterium]|nr:pyridoxal-dependent decarboxylase [Gemmatimonadaceae bacterium]
MTDILHELDADLAPEVARRFLAVTTGYLADTGRRDDPVSTARSNADLYARFDEPLPARGQAVEAVVQRLRDDVVTDANHLYHPRYVGHQVSAPLPAAIWTEPLIGALNQSVAVAEMSPTATAIETRVVRWMTELVGWSAGAGGTLTSGGTEATITALLAARAQAMPDAWTQGVGAANGVIVCGEHAHYSVARAAGTLGLGTANVVTVPSRGWRMDTDAFGATLERLAGEGRTIIAAVATAGSTATGSFDDLEAIGDACERRGIWLHVDGCHGASALLSPTHRDRLRGVSRAQSIAWDPHKMMLLPLSVGALLVRDERVLERAFAQKAPYLFHAGDDERAWDQGVRSAQCSRRADAIKLWVALQRYGANGLGALYDHLCGIARTFHALVQQHPALEALHVPESNIFCFRWVGDRSLDEAALDTRNLALRERYNRSGHGWITTTVLDGRRVLRVTVMNWRTTEDDCRAIVEELVRIAEGG